MIQTVSLRKKGLVVVAGAVAGALALSGCGSANSPLSVVQTDETDIPQLGLPISISGTNAYFTSGTDLTRSDYFTFVLNNAFAGYTTITPIAPAAGAVIEQSGTTITLMHNARLSTRISNISALTVRVGDYVAQGSQLSQTQFAGVNGGNSGFTFEVLLDGQRVCPWSFFSTATRQQLVNIANANAYTYFQQVCSQ